jgi:DNA-binding XRE family transcriptional regulator/desulfoferrodoxin (superoxide reductase-like protein)
MDCGKVGALLYSLRTEMGMTQQQVADRLNISNKTISKWERGLGCPDVSLLGELSGLFQVNIEKILNGSMETNGLEAGNLRHIKFYVCPVCGNIVNNTGNAEISCCGRRLTALTAKPADDAHAASVEETDGATYVTFQHEMSKEHFISFVALIRNDRLLFIKLYPEQEASVILPDTTAAMLRRKRGGGLYYYCTRHGLYQL